MNAQFIEELIKCFSAYNCEIKVKDSLLDLRYKGQPSNRKYLIECFKVDDAGTTGLKISWIFGKVVEPDKLMYILVDNIKKFRDMGPLYGAILPVDDNLPVFLLVGQLIFPPGTPPQEVATISYFNAFLNYTLFELKIPGVEVFM